jgi:subtilase family serine protease
MPNRLASSLVAAVFFISTLAVSAQNRIAQVVGADSAQVAIPDTVNPRARLATDMGEAPADTLLSSVSLRFNMTSAQTAALDQLLSDQQNPKSPRYHQWLTPETYAAQFGLSAADLATVTAYLQSQGLTVTSVARSHSFVMVSGTAAQIGRAFGTTLHKVSLNGEQHIANLNEPSLPAPIAGVTRGITGLNDFRLKPHVRAHQVLAPNYTSSTSGNHYLVPGDIYTIYDINPLLTNSINGAGVTIAVMGQTDISLASAASFRSVSGLSVNPPTVKLFGNDPGTQANDLDEAMLDVEWSGAVAPAASILYVNSTDVIAGSLTQAIDNNLAPIITISYGDCESGFGAGNLAIYNALFRQANVQGQTIVAPAGDSGATDCDYQVASAVGGLAVDYPASSPNVTGVGGTMFNEGSGTYFNATNGNYSGSATSYIPETVWNESATAGSLAASGGGASAYLVKPAFQSGSGVPNDSSRDVPDLSLDSAASHDGYLICAPGFCLNGYRDSGGFLDVIGGTSVASPSFAGMLALLEQKIQSRIGNANPVIYGLANSTYSTAVFHDITSGNNNSPCTAGSTNCASGGSIGYSAGTGYDLATGWGSVDAYNLVSDWLLATPTGVGSTIGQNLSSTSVTASASSVVAGNTVTLTATVAAGTNGLTTAPTGTVQFLVDNVASGSAVKVAGGSAMYVLSTGSLSSGAHTVTAAYSGDTTFAGSKGSAVIDVTSASAADFSLTPSTATATTASGKSAPGITLTVTQLNGFTGNVSFNATSSSSGLIASGVFSVNPVVISSTSNSGTTILTLSAYVSNSITAAPLMKATRASLLPDAAPWRLAGSGVALAGLLCLFVPGRRKRMTGLLVAVLSLGMLSVAGCSSSGTSATSTQTNAAPGTYTILVTASGVNAAGTALSHSSTVTFVVQ